MNNDASRSRPAATRIESRIARSSVSMIKRLFFVSTMIAAVGVPYLMTQSSDWLHSFSSDSKPTGVSYSSSSGATKFSSGSTARPVEGATTGDLSEVLQFDASPEWVLARWPRVTAGLAELDLQGYRVPLVTGTAEDDLAGSLTYYFDKNQKVARINFHGTTGDPRKLITFVTSRYRFLRQKTDDPSVGLYQAKWNGKPQSDLRIRPARVVRADQPHARYEIELAMKRP